MQGHTSIKHIYESTRHLPGLTLVGGGYMSQGIAEEYQFDNYITVAELAACLPQLIPLAHKANWPSNSHELAKTALSRLKFSDH